MVKTVYVLGDSISIQYGPYLAQYLAGFMHYNRKSETDEAELKLDDPQGANGGDSRMVRRFLQAMRDHSGLAADLLLLNCGLHDIKTDPGNGAKQVPLPVYRDNLQAIIKLAVELRLALVWLRTTPCDERVHNRPDMAFHRFAADCERYNAVADEIMTEAGRPIIDLHTFTRNLGRDLYCDHVHFHESIRRQQAAFIAGWLHHFASAV